MIATRKIVVRNVESSSSSPQTRAASEATFRVLRVRPARSQSQASKTSKEEGDPERIDGAGKKKKTTKKADSKLEEEVEKQRKRKVDTDAELWNNKKEAWKEKALSLTLCKETMGVLDQVLKENEASVDKKLLALKDKLTNEREIHYPDDDEADRFRFIGSVNKHGKPHGFGTLYWKNGSRYEGQFQNDTLTGFGVYYWPQNTKRYYGDWVHGKAEGFGILASVETVDASVMKYSGIWQEGLMHGVGRLELETGDSFQGTWAFNCKHGFGVYTWKDGGCRYEGQFEGNQMNGKGTLYWTNGRKLQVDMLQHVSKECWSIAYGLWALFVLLSLASVVHVHLQEHFAEQKRMDASFNPPGFLSLPYVLQFLVVFSSLPLNFASQFLVVSSRLLLGQEESENDVVSSHFGDVKSSSEPLYAEDGTEWSMLPRGRAGTPLGGVSEFGASQNVLKDSFFGREFFLSRWATEIFQSNFALPQLRLLLVGLLHNSLQEMFANIIFNVACWFCHICPRNFGSGFTRERCWYVGLSLGVWIVVVSSCFHVFIHVNWWSESF